MKQFIAAAALGFASLSTCVDAKAPTTPLWTGVGTWIAEQGNAALRVMREEFKADLQGRLQPLQPQPPRREDRSSRMPAV